MWSLTEAKGENHHSIGDDPVVQRTRVVTVGVVGGVVVVVVVLLIPGSQILNCQNVLSIEQIRADRSNE